MTEGSPSRHVCIIAEAGVNHNGSLDLAKQLVDVAADAGADVVKFQTFKADAIVSKTAQKAEYQKRTTGSGETQYEMLKRLELSEADHAELIAHCAARGIRFCSTAFDLDSVRYLNGLDIPFMKVPSGEITNLPYLRAVNACGRPVIMSTGMATLEEVAAAVAVFTRCKVTLLHCTTEYPCPFEAVNLNAMLTLKRHFNLPVGYSDHTRGIAVPVAAVAMGAKVIEKHFTLDRNMEGPDHKASLEPDELKEMVLSIRAVEKSLGSGEKAPASSELKNIVIARKSIVAKRAICVGEVFGEDNLTVKRPGDGLSPMLWDRVVGKIADRNYEADEKVVI